MRKVKPLASSPPLPAPLREGVIELHSARHAFAGAARRAKVEPEILSRLLGHGAGNMTARYGSGHDLKALQGAVNAVRYGVEYPHER